MITTATLRTNLIAALGSNLGLYTRPDGGTEQAIAVIPHNQYGYDYPPSNYQVTGVEGVILKPKIAIKMAHYGALKRVEFEVFLKFWTNTGILNQTTELVADYLVDQGYQIKSPVYIPYDEKMGILAASKIPIYEFVQRISDG